MTTWIILAIAGAMSEVYGAYLIFNKENHDQK